MSGSGGLFTKLGHHAGVILDILASQGSTITAPDYSVLLTTKVNSIVADYAAGTAEKNIVDGVYASLAQYQQVNPFVQYLSGLSQSTIIDMANADTPLASKTLQAALTLLIQQMNTASASVQASSVAAGAQTAGSPAPTGNPIIVVSTKYGNGLNCEYLLPETLTFKISADNQSGGATANQEPCAISGQVAAPNVWDYRWPLGTGLNVTVNLIDATQNATGGTLLQNGEFLTATTTNNLDNWTILVGTAGTTIFQGGSGYRDNNSLQFTGDGGGTLSSVAQTFNTTPSSTIGAGGTAAKLLPDVPYAVNFWVKCSATPSAGVVEVSLVDGSNAIIADDQSVNNSFTKSLTAVSTSWVNVNCVFRLPKALPTTIKLRVRLSTAIDSGKSVFIDGVAMGGSSNASGMTPLYSGIAGPSVSIFAGSTKVLVNDFWTIALTNTWGKFQQYVKRAFAIDSFNLQLPSVASSPSVSESLVS